MIIKISLYIFKRITDFGGGSKVNENVQITTGTTPALFTHDDKQKSNR